MPLNAGGSDVGSCSVYTSVTSAFHPRVSYPHSFVSPSPSLMSTPIRLLVVSRTGKSCVFHTRLLSSSRLPPAAPPTMLFANPNRLPVRLGRVWWPIVPVPKFSAHRDPNVLLSCSVEGISEPEPIGWCNSRDRSGSSGSGGMYDVEGANRAMRRACAHSTVVVPTWETGFVRS